MPGSFRVDQLGFHAERLRFVGNRPLKPDLLEAPDSEIALSNALLSCVLQVYPRPESLQTTLNLPNELHLDQTRSVDVEILTGWNNVLEVEMRLKAASGLRLRLAEARIVADDAGNLDSIHQGFLKLGPIAAEQSVKIRIPYSLESEAGEISVS